MREDITDMLRLERDPDTELGVFFSDIRSGVFSVDPKGFDVAFIDNYGVLNGFRGDVVDGKLVLTEDSRQ